MIFARIEIDCLDCSQEQYKPLSMSCQHKFIAFADFLLHKGVDVLLRHVHAAVDHVLRSKPLKDPYTASDLRIAFEKIRQSFSEHQDSWVQYVLPEDNLLPEDLAAASSAADAARLSMEESSAFDDGEKLEYLMAETRNVLSRRTIPTEQLRNLGIPLPPVGRYMTRFQLKS